MQQDGVESLQSDRASLKEKLCLLIIGYHIIIIIIITMVTDRKVVEWLEHRRRVVRNR